MSGSPLITKQLVLSIPDTGPDADPRRPHRFVVLNNACKGNDHLVVPICSVPAKGFHDPACVLNVGDHVDVKHKSFILYQAAKRLYAKNLEAQVAKGDVLLRAALSDDVFARVAKGMLLSKFATPVMLKYYKENKDR